jgi:hypothetical protein
MGGNSLQRQRAEVRVLVWGWCSPTLNSFASLRTLGRGTQFRAQLVLPRRPGPFAENQAAFLKATADLSTPFAALRSFWMTALGWVRAVPPLRQKSAAADRKDGRPFSWLGLILRTVGHAPARRPHLITQSGSLGPGPPAIEGRAKGADDGNKGPPYSR